MTQTDITGVVYDVNYPHSLGPESIFCLVSIEGESAHLVGEAERGKLVTGLKYQFQGHRETHPTHGPQFKFLGFLQCQPVTPDAIKKYLARYAPPRCGMGPVTIQDLVDAFGVDTLAMIRTQPGEIRLACPRISRDQAAEMARVFTDLADLEATKINLMSLFAGRGFLKTLVDDAIKKWGILAYDTIKTNPFILLTERMRGCGFGLTDRLYIDLGLDPVAIERQMFCAWDVIRSDKDGHTWLSVKLVRMKLQGAITSAQANHVAAIKKGVEEGWLATVVDGEGKRWIADGKRAANEETLAAHLR